MWAATGRQRSRTSDTARTSPRGGREPTSIVSWSQISPAASRTIAIMLLRAGLPNDNLRPGPAGGTPALEKRPHRTEGFDQGSFIDPESAAAVNGAIRPETDTQ